MVRVDLAAGVNDFSVAGTKSNLEKRVMGEGLRDTRLAVTQEEERPSEHSAPGGGQECVHSTDGCLEVSCTQPKVGSQYRAVPSCCTTLSIPRTETVS